MQDNKDDKFLTSEINNLSSNFEDIKINNEKIEEISKKNESSLEQFFKSSESEVIKLMSYGEGSFQEELSSLGRGVAC